MVMPDFCPIWGFPVAYMHSVCLGVAKRMAFLWFAKKYSSSHSHCFRRWAIDALLKKVNPPRGIKRLPRSLSEKQHWKGIFFFFFLIHPPSEFFLSLLSFSLFLFTQLQSTGISCCFMPQWCCRALWPPITFNTFSCLLALCILSLFRTASQ